MRFAMLDSETATFQGACGVAFRLLEPVEEDDGWKLRASNIEPWEQKDMEMPESISKKSMTLTRKIFSRNESYDKK